MRAALLEGMAAGETTTSLLTRLGVSWREVWRWTREDSEFGADYAHARVAQAHAMADAVIALADSATPENAAAVRLMIDARKWLASKIAPKIYGERVQVDQDNTVRVVIERESPPALVLDRIA